MAISLEAVTKYSLVEIDGNPLKEIDFMFELDHLFMVNIIKPTVSSLGVIFKCVHG